MKLTKPFIDAVQVLDRAFVSLEANWDDNHDSFGGLCPLYPFNAAIQDMKFNIHAWRDAIILHYVGLNDVEEKDPSIAEYSFAKAFHIYEQGKHIIESLQSGRTFKKEWVNEEFTLDVRESQTFSPEEIRGMWSVTVLAYAYTVYFSHDHDGYEISLKVWAEDEDAATLRAEKSLSEWFDMEQFTFNHAQYSE